MEKQGIENKHLHLAWNITYQSQGSMHGWIWNLHEISPISSEEMTEAARYHKQPNKLLR